MGEGITSLPEGPEGVGDGVSQLRPVRPLSERQADVLRLLAEGLTDEEMARELSIGVGSVRSYRRQIYHRLGAKNGAHAVAIAAREGLLPATTD
jgi:DNA-binding CsgD family transcriptional regulator